MNSQSYDLFLVAFYTYVLPLIIIAVAYSIWRVGINTFNISEALKEIKDKIDSD